MYIYLIIIISNSRLVYKDYYKFNIFKITLLANCLNYITCLFR